MLGFEQIKDDLAAEGISVYAASVDDPEHAGEVQTELSFPVAYGVTREQADALGSWWEDRRNIIQPSEFVLGPDRTVLSATYSSGPIGRLDAADVLKLVQFLKSR